MICVVCYYLQLQDFAIKCFSDPYLAMEISLTVEDLAERHGITREQSDKYALQSLQRWAKGKYNHPAINVMQVMFTRIKLRCLVTCFAT